MAACPSPDRGGSRSFGESPRSRSFPWKHCSSRPAWSRSPKSATTQLLTLVLAARYKRPWPIIAGIFVATLVNHFVAGAVGAWLGSALDDDALRWVLGISFLAMAAWMLVPDKLEDGAAASRPRGGVFLTTTFLLFFMIEIGNKTQIATVALAARFDSLVAVVIGTTVGMLLANAPVAYFGEALAKRLPVRTVV